SAPILNEGNMLAFCVFERKKTLSDFLDEGKEKMMQQQLQSTLNTNEERLDLLHTTTLPWHSFTAFKHPKRLDKQDSIPKIAWGKYIRNASSIQMPIAIEVNHALMDGIHVAQFITSLQEKLYRMDTAHNLIS
ncbi:MAG TPA: CatA-like O-acetyltransferase, partial [Flavisolibacter sp.]|nr:CatA-like O-acetyltransferase [Flavisolibacter sp.]